MKSPIFSSSTRKYWLTTTLIDKELMHMANCNFRVIRKKININRRILTISHSNDTFYLMNKIAIIEKNLHQINKKLDIIKHKV